jgi:hypothetical protein
VAADIEIEVAAGRPTERPLEPRQERAGSVLAQADNGDAAAAQERRLAVRVRDEPRLRRGSNDDGEATGLTCGGPWCRRGERDRSADQEPPYISPEVTVRTIIVSARSALWVPPKW